MRVFSFLSKKLLIYTGLILVIAVVVFVWVKDSNGKEIAVVTRASVVQEVTATGKIKPNQSVNLAFDKSGRVASVYALVGEKVKEGQVIASLEAGEVTADLAKAEALLLEENIKLREIKSTAPISYSDAAKNLEAVVREGFADADNAVRNKVDQFFKTPSVSPRFEITFSDGNFVHYFSVPTELTMEINEGRRKVESILADWQKRADTLAVSNLVSEADKAIKDLNTISLFLDKVASAVNTFSPAEFAYNSTVEGYKSDASSARSDVSGAISAIVVAKDKFNTAPTLGQTGQFESVLAQEAKVSQALAAVSSLKASLAKSTIRAPFDGVITLQDAKVGATVSTGATLVSVVSENEMYIEANISEINIGKITLANPVLVTFDAFPKEEFLGEVSYIEPGDVLIDGVVNYKIRVNLKVSDSRIKTGLTANLKIETLKKENVLALPRYAVSEENGQNFVNKIYGKTSQKTSVTLGTISKDGLVEILSGLEEGDRVEF